MNKKHIDALIILFIACVCLFSLRFYPQQQLSDIKVIVVKTPEFDKYHDDCLHPCIRKNIVCVGGGYKKIYWLVQSPYYRWNNKVENPIIYKSENLHYWLNGTIVANTPEYGYNSDPNIYLQGDTTYIFWRECNTPLCDSLKAQMATVGVFTLDGKTFSKKKIYLTNSSSASDTEQCPICIKWKGKYRFYCVWYQYSPTRENKGLAIWEGNSLNKPDFELVDTIAIPQVHTADKLVQKSIFSYIVYIPTPLKYDLWHMDLVEYNGKLLMVSSSEKGDNIMLSESVDGINFKTHWKPLVNNHYMENKIHYRQYYYKPTAIIENDSLKVFFTTNSQNGDNNILCCSSIPLK